MGSPPLLAGKTVGEATPPDIEPLHGDMRSEWQRYSDAAIHAWSSTDPRTQVHLSYGTVPLEPYLRQQIADVTIHAWDLAKPPDPTTPSTRNSSPASGRISTANARCSPRAGCSPTPSTFPTTRRSRIA